MRCFCRRKQGSGNLGGGLISFHPVAIIYSVVPSMEKCLTLLADLILNLTSQAINKSWSIKIEALSSFAFLLQMTFFFNVPCIKDTAKVN